MNYLELALELVKLATQLVPSIEADVAAAKGGLSTNDLAAAQAQIDSLHRQSQDLTAQLDALRG
jgi:hypothetical protein